MPMSCWWRKAEVMFTASRGARSCHGGCRRGIAGRRLPQLWTRRRLKPRASNPKPGGVWSQQKGSWVTAVCQGDNIRALCGLKRAPWPVSWLQCSRNFASDWGRSSPKKPATAAEGSQMPQKSPCYVCILLWSLQIHSSCPPKQVLATLWVSPFKGKMAVTVTGAFSAVTWDLPGSAT